MEDDRGGEGGEGERGRGRGKERAALRRGQRRGTEESASATSHVNIRLCVRYGGVRPQFAWKLRHYRRGPPESNHSSNGPVCRHLGGGRLSPEHPTPYLSLSFPSFSAASLPLALVLSPPRVVRPHDTDTYSRDVTFSHSPRMFRLRRGITAGSLRFYR